MGFLKMLLSEDNGNPSTMRVVVALVVLIMVGTWAYVSISNKALAPMSVEEVGLMLGAMGIKAFQKGKEANVDAKEARNQEKQEG